MKDFEFFYQKMGPEINRDFPIAKDENDYENVLIDGYHKVLRGFRVLNEFCEWAVLAKKSGRLVETDEYYSDDGLFPDFAHALAEEVARVTSCFVHFKPDQSVDLMALYTEVIDYLHLVFEEDRLWGDFFDRIGGALIHLSMADPEIEEALFIAWILDLNDPASEGSNAFYAETFTELERRLLGDSEQNEVLVERFYVGALAVSIVATDEDVEFIVDGWAEDFVKGEWDEDYKYGQIYRNDKQVPDSKKDWLALMAPEKGQGLELGKRSYKKLEDAIKRESAWVAGVGSFFR